MVSSSALTTDTGVSNALINVPWAHILGMLHLVETNEIANPVPVGFLRADAVVIHTNDGMNLIAQSKWLPIHGLTPEITVYSYRIIVRVDHRSQMITWKNRKCSTNLLFYKSMGTRLWRPERVIMKRSHFRNRGGAYQVTVRLHKIKTILEIEYVAY